MKWRPNTQTKKNMYRFGLDFSRNEKRLFNIKNPSGNI